MKRNWLQAILLVVLGNSLAFSQTKEVDICIYGGSSAGVMAAYTAKMAGKSVLLIEPGSRLGGLTTGGLGYTDIGNKYAISGLALDYYRRLGKHYGKFESWIFEPGVAENLFKEYLKKANVEVWYELGLKEVKKKENRITEISLVNPETEQAPAKQIVRAKMYLDCTYEGDLMAKAGVSYTIGREANSLYGETYNGVQLMNKHQFPDGIDPYKKPGDPSSGLLWGISPAKLDEMGAGDKKVQAYNFRICLSRDPKNQLPITQPDNYNPERYELLLRYLQHTPATTINQFLKVDLMPNNKTDINNNGPFSTDMIGMNYDYAEAGFGKRKEITTEHANYVKGLLYFIGNDPRMPEHLRKQMKEWGYPKDEYQETGNWSPQMYVREARRMVGSYVMTQANCQGREVVTDGVGMAAYTMDSHNCQRLVVNGMVKNEGDVQIGGFGPYPISYRSLIPQKKECENLLVPVCLSASHIAYGSIRMEPVFMVLAQSSALAASMAIDQKKAVQDINVPALQAKLKSDPLADGSTPDIYLDNANPAQVRVNGSWKKELRIGFGPDFLVAGKEDAQANVEFFCQLPKKGKYAVYMYTLPKYPGLAKETLVKVSDGKSSQQVTINRDQLQVSGQTSGEWVRIGEYDLQGQASIQIKGAGKEEAVIADAILIKPLF